MFDYVSESALSPLLTQNPVDVVLLRGDDTHTLTLLPAKWEGNGLIGAALRLL